MSQLRDTFIPRYYVLDIPVTVRGVVQISQVLPADISRIRGFALCGMGIPGYGNLRLRINEGLPFFDSSIFAMYTTFGKMKPTFNDSYDPYYKCDSGEHEQILLKGTYETLFNYAPPPYTLKLALLCETRSERYIQKFLPRALPTKMPDSQR